MIYHGGLLDDDPAQNSLYRWARSSQLDRMPLEIATPLRVWFLTPGITKDFHRTAFRISDKRVMKHVTDAERHQSELMPLVVENWLSVRRPDAVKLSQYRKPNMHFPLICRLQMVEDAQVMSQEEVARIYGTSSTLVRRILKRGPFSGVELPHWFDAALF